jgi:hypothetical protein
MRSRPDRRALLPRRRAARGAPPRLERAVFAHRLHRMAHDKRTGREASKRAITSPPSPHSFRRARPSGDREKSLWIGLGCGSGLGSERWSAS